MASIDYSDTNVYPRIERIENVTTAAQHITLPRDCTKITFGSTAALHFANVGEHGDVFGQDITAYAFVPTQNLLTISMEVGRQSNRSLLIGTQNGAAAVVVIIEKDK